MTTAPTKTPPAPRPVTPRPLWERHQLFQEPVYAPGLERLEDDCEDDDLEPGA